jgi:hypothetical protein
MHRRVKILLILFFLFATVRAQISSLKVTWEYRGQTFSEFVSSAESVNGVNFFYREEWTEGIRLQDYGNQPLLFTVLETLFRGINIYFISDNEGNIIITKNYKIKTFAIETAKAENFLPPTDYSQSENQKSSNENIISEIGNPAEKGKSGNVSVSGYLRSKGSGEPLTGVAIYIRELAKGTVTNEYGFYSINLPRGNYNIRYSLLGMKESLFRIKVYGSGKFDVEMTETLIPLKETVVTAEKNNVLERFEVGLEKLNMRTFRLMPTSMGETDILKSMLLLPGVKTVGEGSSGFNVRGGAADQNLILLYGAPVFNTSHLFGFFTAVNSDIIKDVLLYKGGIPARYGGRISSVIDIIPRDGSKETFRGNAGISPITAHLTTEIPLIKNKMSLLLAARSTYSNWVLGMINNQAIRNSKAFFYDFNGRIVYDINPVNRIELSSYISHDSFRFNTDTTYNYDNKIFSLRWRHTFSDNLLVQFSANSSLYNYSINSDRNPENSFILRHKLDYSNFKADFNLYSFSNHLLNFGAEIIRYSILPGELNPGTDSSLVSYKILENEKAYEGALYVEDKITITNRLSVNLGLRYSIFSAVGPRAIRIYDPNHPMSAATVTDTLYSAPGDIFKTYSGPEYRISLNFLLTPKSSLKLNYNRTRQYLHLLSNTTSISPTDTWKLSDYYLKPQTGDQYSAGYYLSIPRKGMEFSAEAYFKPVRNMIDFKGGATLTMNEYLEREIINVSGKAYGIELMLKKNMGKIAWGIGYTYSRIFLRSITEFESDAINSGTWFPASYDKPNDLNISFNCTATRRLSFSFNYTYNTGRPVTYPVTVYLNSNMWIVQYSDRNKYRIPDYSRLDFSARLSGNLRSHKIMNPYWTFSWFNVLGRANVYSVYFTTSGNKVNGYQLSVFARSIPTLTYNFSF